MATTVDVGLWADIVQAIVDEVIDWWRKRLQAFMKAKREHFEHLLWLAVAYCLLLTRIISNHIFCPKPGELWKHSTVAKDGVDAFGYITLPKVNGFGWSLKHCEHIAGDWPYQILGAIRAVATVWEAVIIFLSGK